MNKIKKIKINKKNVLKFMRRVSGSRRLLFIIFWGVILIYSFNILYKKVYIDIGFINYDVASSSGVSKEISKLNKISEDIETRHKKQQDTGNKLYRDPFKFAGEAVGLSAQLENKNASLGSVAEQKAVPGQW